MCMYTHRHTHTYLLYFLIAGQLFHNVVLASAIHHCEPAVITQTHPPFWASFRPSPLGHHTAPGWAPCVISNFSPAIYFTHDTVYIYVYTHHTYIHRCYFLHSSHSPSSIVSMSPWRYSSATASLKRLSKNVTSPKAGLWLCFLNKERKEKILLQSKNVEDLMFLDPLL